MKYIQKESEPQEFTDWKNQENSDWSPTWDNLGGSVKQAVKQALMTEQGYICCYCEDRLKNDNYHIEHFQPKSDPVIDPLDFSNLLCSCQKDLKKQEPVHCGKLKGDWFDEKQLISPLDPTCEERFAFTADGWIQPADDRDEGAITTIEKLGLNIPKLRDLRQNAIEPFIDPSLSDEDLEDSVKNYLKFDNFGQFNPFWTTIRYLFGT